VAGSWLYDGQSAVRREVDVEPEAQGLLIKADSGETWSVRSDELIHVETRGEHQVYGLSGVAGWRLGIAEPVGAEIAALLPRKQVYGRWVDRVGLGPALAIGLAFSAAILSLGYTAPAWLAPLVPRSWEKSFGDALVGDFGEKTCASGAGQQALDKLAARLTSHPEHLKVRVMDVRIVNAVALPGGNIILFQGLLHEAESPDEVAGVLAHEIAHVENRDVTQALIRHLGLGILIASFGGNTGANIEALMAARYSRKAESRADADAIAALRHANISPLGTAAFFDRLGKIESKYGRVTGALEYISSHPLSAKRRAAFRASAEPGKKYAPALAEQQWGALQDICFKPSTGRPTRS
jgi:beta-barrel assembly-enhancing protease